MTYQWQQIAPTNLWQIPDGPAGTRETLKHMREEIRKDKRNTWVRDFAQTLCRDVDGKDWWGEIVAVFDFVQNNIRYSLDTNGIEVIQSPHLTLELGYGDCDDFVCLVSCLLEHLGHTTYLCALGFDADENYSHVIALCSGAGGETPLIPLDATEQMPCGWFPPGHTYAMIAEIEAGGAPCNGLLQRMGPNWRLGKHDSRPRLFNGGPTWNPGVAIPWHGAA